MNLADADFDRFLGNDETVTQQFEPPLVNIGYGDDVTIKDLAALVKQVVGFEGEIVLDTSKPDGTPRKLLDVSRLNSLGWRAPTTLQEGLSKAYADYLG